MVDDHLLHTIIGITETTIVIADRHFATEVTVVTETHIIDNRIISIRIAISVNEISTITQTVVMIVNDDHLLDNLDKLLAGSAMTLGTTAIIVISTIAQTIANMIVTTIDLTTDHSGPPIIVCVDFQAIETQLNFVPIMMNNSTLAIVLISTLKNI